MLPTGEVESFTVHRPSGGQGYMGDTVRVELAYRDAPDGAPMAIAAKFAIPVPANRGLAEAFGLYQREIWFYRTLASRLPVRVPRMIHAELDSGLPYGLVKAAQSVLGRLPRRMLAAYVANTDKLVRPTRRRYVLLIEWLDEGRTRPIADVPTHDELDVALEVLAELHARFWVDSELAKMSDAYLRPVASPTPRALQALFRSVRPGLAARLGASGRGDLLGLLDGTDRALPAIVRRLNSGPRTFIHGDPRLDNWLFFDDSGGVALLDWSGMTRARAGWDVGYLLSAALDGPDARAELDGHVERYLTRLRSLGVAVDRQMVRDDVALTHLFLAHQNAVAGAVMDDAQRDGTSLTDLWFERVAALLPPRLPRI